MSSRTSSETSSTAAVGAREGWDASWGDNSKGSELDSRPGEGRGAKGGHPHHEGPAQGKHRHDCRGGKTQTQLWQSSGNLPQITSSLSRGHSQAPSRSKEKLPAGPGATSPPQCHPGLATRPACTLPRPEPPARVSTGPCLPQGYAGAQTPELLARPPQARSPRAGSLRSPRGTDRLPPPRGALAGAQVTPPVAALGCTVPQAQPRHASAPVNSVLFSLNSFHLVHKASLQLLII